MSEAGPGADHYKVLGVSREATPAELKKAFFRLIRRYTPEDSPDQFRRISQAYRVLSDPDARREYDEEEQVPPDIAAALDGIFATLETDPPAARQRATALLERHGHLEQVRFSAGLVDLHLENWPSADRILGSLAEEHPGKAVYAKLLAVALFHGGKRQEGIAKGKEAVVLDPSDTDVYLTLADLYMEMERDDLAIRVLNQGIRADGQIDVKDLPLFIRKILIFAKKRDWRNMERSAEWLAGAVPDGDDEARAYVAHHFRQLAAFFNEAGLPHLTKFAMDRALRLVPEDTEAQRISEDLEPAAELHREAENLYEDKRVEEWVKFVVALYLSDAPDEEREEQYLRIADEVTGVSIAGMNQVWEETREHYPTVLTAASVLWQEIKSQAVHERRKIRRRARRQVRRAGAEETGCVVLLAVLLSGFAAVVVAMLRVVP